MAVDVRELRLRPLAEADLEQVWLYTSKHWSREQADKYVKDIILTMELLAGGTKVGRQCMVRDEYFQYAVASHIVFYRVQKQTLEVVRVLHQRMDVERRL